MQRGTVELRGVRKQYTSRNGREQFVALDRVDLSIPGGSIFGVIGRSGAGKSTLLRTINLLERPTEGTVVLDGEDITRLTNSRLAGVRRRIGMIFQQFSLMSSKTVWENVRLPLRLAGVDDTEADRKVADLLALVGLQNRADSYPAQLSGGQKQRVGIARALVHDPEVLLSDEATSALDPETTRSILDLLRRINAERGVTIVLVTHEMSVIQEIADRVAVVDAGAVVEQGPVWEVFSSSTHPVTQELLRSVRRDRADDLADVVSVHTDPDATRVIARFDGSTPIDLDSLAGHATILASSIVSVQGRPQGYVLLEVDHHADVARITQTIRSIAHSVEVLAPATPTVESPDHQPDRVGVGVHVEGGGW